MTQGATSLAILCAGRFYCDLIFTDVPRLPSLGTEVFAGAMGLHPGGGAFITGAHLASLGHRVALASVLPGAPFREAVMPEMERAGLDLDLCRPQAPGLDAQVTVAIAGQNDRAFLTRRSGPALPDLPADAFAMCGAAHLHIGELATLVERPDLIEIARRAGASISLDCGWDEGLLPSDIGDALTGIDIFLPNEAEADWISDMGLSGQLPPLTVIKRGSAGATALIDGQEITAAAKPVQAIDTTGAGDAFNAGFLSAWLAGRPPLACLSHGNALGARAISDRGGFHGVPEAEAVSASSI
ncbi:carbohydrate kinase family protein [Actibacterium sp. 188UL27-1]|uniref:carbohydrate kinase family protein n=1 Tax=Actibacterium sp. 188UL27-1 TaxID=2786961 RepID=UPI00195C474A|nr:carbohydrate kinase family protein [Actibacterium sp. 188UL27-1]MBM7069804.1 carbohydrate kinase family protein [Actibacterium sp. 188UL27-1]